MKELLKIRDFMKEMRRPSASSPSSLFLFMMALAMMMLVPSAVNAVTMTMDFNQAGIAAANAPSNPNYEANIIMSNQDYNNIGNGAKIGNKISYRYNSSSFIDIDISRLAFVVNNGGGDGFNLRYDKIVSGGNTYRVAGLYNQKWGQKLAVLDLMPGDKVKFTYSGSTDIDNDANGNGNGNLHNDNYNTWMTQVGKGQTATVTVDINFEGDLIVSANKGTIINSIDVELKEATYDIRTENNGKTTVFEFTGAGRILENDFAVPYMTVSFGSTNDKLLVDNSGGSYQCRMVKSNNSEAMETDGYPYFRPIAGNFYEFKPTGGGEITITGGFKNGGNVHLFVFDPSPNVNGWVQNIQGKWYKETIESPSSHYGSYTFSVEKNLIYYVCIDKDDENEVINNAFHLHSFSFTNSFKMEKLAAVIDLEGNYSAIVSTSHY